MRNYTGNFLTRILNHLSLSDGLDEISVDVEDDNENSTVETGNNNAVIKNDPITTTSINESSSAENIEISSQRVDEPSSSAVNDNNLQLLAADKSENYEKK